MISSDSEDDCYTNVALKLQKMKNKFQEPTSKNINRNIVKDPIENSTNNTNDRNTETVRINPEDSLSNAEDEIEDELFIQNLLNSRKPLKRITRSSTRRNYSASNDSLYQTSTCSSSRKSSSANASESDSRSRGRKKRNGQNGSSRNSTSPRRGARRGTPNRGHGTPNRGHGTPNRGHGTPNRNGTQNRSRGTPNRSHGRSRRRVRHNVMDSFFPIYSVGNTDEYTDTCDNQALFSNQPANIVDLDESDPLDENEELSVKVYWQNLEYFKFTIRKYQKLTQIFDFFAQKENISRDKLLFTFNDKILKADDTPDSINYNIAKFIDGGIVNQSVSQIVMDVENYVHKGKNGIKIKFQCQNMKKPYQTMIQLDDKMLLAMVKCAEHLEKPLHKLKFEFDGDSISGQSTPRELELEGGETIDVKILS